MLKVENVRLHNVTAGENLVMWSGVKTRCLSTYHVLFSTSGKEGKYALANPQGHLIFSAYVHALSNEDIYKAKQSNSTVFYKIVAEDYFGQMGPASVPVSIQL